MNAFRLSVFLFVVVFLITTFVPSIGVAGWWRSKKDNKPVAELELMDDKELCSEATDVCSKIVIEKKFSFPNGTSERLKQLQNIVDGQEYMRLISRVARKKHNGETPVWMKEATKIAEGTEPRECLEVLKKHFLDKKQPGNSP